MCPKWLRAHCGLGDPGGAWSRVNGLNFSAASTLHFSSFPQIILLPSWCQIFCSLHKSLSPSPQIILLQTSSSTARLRYATLGSPPPLGRPSTERPLCVSVSLPIPPLSCLLPWRTGGLLSGWVEASLGATLHGDCFIANQKLISLSCAQTELKLLLSTAGLKIKPKLLIQFLTPPLSLSYSLPNVDNLSTMVFL